MAHVNGFQSHLRSLYDLWYMQPSQFLHCSGQVRWPNHLLDIFGIKVDTMPLELRLAAHKLEHLKTALKKWSHLKSCWKEELQSQLGLLHDASMIIRPGHTFLCCLTWSKVSTTVQHPVFSALTWQFTQTFYSGAPSFMSWNGLSMMHPYQRQNPEEVILTSDAQWLQYQWFHQ